MMHHFNILYSNKYKTRSDSLRRKINLGNTQFRFWRQGALERESSWSTEEHMELSLSNKQPYLGFKKEPISERIQVLNPPLAHNFGPFENAGVNYHPAENRTQGQPPPETPEFLDSRRFWENFVIEVFLSYRHARIRVWLMQARHRSKASWSKTARFARPELYSVCLCRLIVIIFQCDF